MLFNYQTSLKVFKKWANNRGFYLLCTRLEYFSKIDPNTGFVNYFYTKYENLDKAQKFFEAFESIRFNGNYFEFKVDQYSKFNPKAVETQQEWTICTYGQRIETKRDVKQNNNFVSREVELTTLFEDFFGKHRITYGDGNCLKKDIDIQEDKKFFEELMHLFKLTLQMRNSVTGTDEDYLISPVKNQDGYFYDSRKADETLPKDADANGAYNIARKGWMLIDKIKKADLSKKIDLSISNKDWLNFAQKNI
jgi:CRISPR-associated protein Cpf1